MVKNAIENANTDTLLDVKHLFVDYHASSGTVHAVTDVNLSLKHGEMHMLLRACYVHPR